MLTFEQLVAKLEEEVPTNVAGGVANPDNKMLGKKKCKCEDDDTECECDKTKLLKRKSLEESAVGDVVKRTVPCKTCGGMHYVKTMHNDLPEWMCKNCTVSGGRQVRTRMKTFNDVENADEIV